MRGLQEGVDPALPDSLYQSLFAPDLENFRVAGGKFEPRLGQSIYKTLPGSGAIKLLDNYYTSTGDRIRLSARLTVIYKLKEGTDANFVTITQDAGFAVGATGVTLYQGVNLGDVYYLLDKTTGLYRLNLTPSSGNQLQLVANPTAPSVAPRTRARWFDRLEPWNDLTVWAKSNNTRFDLLDTTATNPPPGGGHSVNLLIQTTNATGETITENVTSEGVNSHQIAFWAYQRIDNKTFVQFGIGITGPDSYNLPLQTAQPNSWFPFYLAIGSIGTVNYKRFKVLDASRAPNGLILSPLYLPGNLEGWYRWIYTYYDPTTGRESAPSPVSNSGASMDFSVVGITNKQETNRAFQKACLLDFTSSGGATSKIRIYRNGGVPSLTKDQSGNDIWLRVGEIFDQSTTCTSNPLAVGSVTMTVASATNIAIGDLLVINKGSVTGGVGNEEYLQVTGVAGNIVSFKAEGIDTGTVYQHNSGAPVQIAFMDNTSNESIDVTHNIDRERDNPPVGAQWIVVDPDGRLWLANYSGQPTAIAVSNKSTTDRPHDYETFPDNVDPITRKSRTQGFRFKIGGDITDNSITWMGTYQGVIHVMTMRHLYIIHAKSQVDYGPLAIQKVLNLGCLNGNTVAEVNGSLIWVTDGPRVVMWGGRGSEPQIISHLKVNERLRAAPTSLWNQWFAVAHRKKHGEYYQLWFTPSGQTTNTQRLDYNVDQEAWEPVVYYDGAGNPLSYSAASVRQGGTDVKDQYQAATTGVVYLAETTNLDDTVPIKVRFKSKRIPLSIYSRFPSGAIGDVAPGSTRHLLLGQVTMLTQLFIRLLPVDDTLTLTVVTGGSEYGDISHPYVIDLNNPASAGATGTDLEQKQRLHRDLYGRWAQVTLAGDFSNAASIREITLLGLPLRSGAIQT